MSWRYLRTSDHLTNISKLVLSSQQQQQQAFSVAATSSSNSKYSTEIMKLLKPNSLTNITIFFAASLVAGWSMPLLVDGNQEFGDKDTASASAVEQDPTSAHATGTATESQNVKTSAANTVKATSDKTMSQSYQQRNKNCPSYGCPLLPRDIYFDKEAQAALQTIRNLQKVTTTSTNAAAAASTDTKANDPNESNNNNGNQNLISLFYNEAYINTDRSEDQATLTLIGYKGGEIHEQINQDRAFVISPFYIFNKDADTEKYDQDENDSTLRLLGVFDGHARLGEQVSEYSVRQLPQTLSSKLEPILSSSTSLSQQQQQIQEAINDTFIEIDKTAPAHESGGCTASIVLQIHNQVFVANAGDSRSFIATYNKRTRKTSIAYITREDKPDIPEERQRVESAGGVVYVPPPDRMLAGASSRVVYVDKITGSRNGLAMSRSIGDWAAGDHGVIPNPTVDVLDINELIQNAATSGENGSQECIANYNEEKKDDNGCQSNDAVEVFAVSATDGLLDFVDVDNIASTIATSLYETDSPHPLSACESLITAAASSWWQAKNGRYRDDIAIAVSKLSLS